jgi:hypothetical protein
MADHDLTDQELADFLEDSLDPIRTATLEKLIRNSPELQERLDRIRIRFDGGEHSLGAVWQRDRLSCPTRDELSAYLNQILDPAPADYLKFHLEVIACPFCLANLEDLQARNAEQTEKNRIRQSRILESSAGLLQKLQEK